MPKSKTSHPEQPVAGAAKSKKTAPINHVILKRIGDLKTLVADLTASNEDKAIAGLDLGSEVQKQTSEIEALRNELQNFQSGILSSFCDALDERLRTQPVDVAKVVSGVEAVSAADKAEQTPPSKALDQNNTVVLKNRPKTKPQSEGLEEDTWESIRSAFLTEHEIDEESDSTSQASFASTPFDDLTEETPVADSAVVNLAEAQQLDLSADSSRTHTDNVEDTEDDLDFQHSDIIADLDSLDEVTLRTVVNKQERLILGLIRRLRTKYNNRPTMTCEQLEAVKDLADEELSTRITETLAILHNQQRQGELELSLERAKLSRRRTELEQLEDRIEGRARTLGVVINDDGDLEDAPSVDRGTGTKSRRWLGAMGFGNS